MSKGFDGSAVLCSSFVRKLRVLEVAPSDGSCLMLKGINLAASYVDCTKSDTSGCVEYM